MKCGCVQGERGFSKLCDEHQNFINAATRSASREVWSGAIHVYEEVQREVADLVSEKHQTAAQLGVKLYRDALRKRIKD